MSGWRRVRKNQDDYEQSAISKSEDLKKCCVSGTFARVKWSALGGGASGLENLLISLDLHSLVCKKRGLNRVFSMVLASSGILQV